MRALTQTLLLLFATLACWGQAPNITESPQNAGSYAQSGLPHGSLAQGTMFIVKGTGFGPCNATNTVIASSFPLNPVMRQVQIRVTMNGTNYNAWMIYVVVCRAGAPDQLAAILPSNVPTGTGTMQVLLNGTPSAPIPVKVIARSFGVFTWNQAGSGPVIVQNFISEGNTPTNGLFESANPGQIEVLWGVGLGAVDSTAERNGPVPGDLPISVDVYIGGKKAEVTYRGRSGCCAGIDQIVFKVPQNVSPGCYVSVAVVVNDVLSNVGTMSVASSGKVCAEATRFSSTDISRLNKSGPLRVGDISVNRFSVTAGAIQGSVDTGEGSFRTYASTAELMAAAPHSIAGLRGAPSPGSCIVSTYKYDSNNGALEAAIPDVPDSPGQQMDAGANLTLVNAQSASKQIPKQLSNGFIDGYYLPDGVFLGGGIPAAGIPQTPDFLIPGNLSVNNGTGGPANGVGAFNASLTIPSSFATWSNQGSINTVTRSQGVTVNWGGGGASDLVAVIASSADPSSAVGAGAGVICVERASAGSLTIPSYLLSNLPPSGLNGGIRVGWLTFGTTLSQPTRFTAPGLDAGYFNWLTAQVKNVLFQ